MSHDKPAIPPNTRPQVSTTSLPPSEVFGYAAPPKASRPTQKSSASSYTHLQFLFGVQDLAMLNSKGGRNQRKLAQAPDHVKHRRTRSGCYTCRSRRVKCDEHHPICDRCRKGGRECIFPSETPGTKSSSSSSKGAASTGAGTSPDDESSDEDEEEEENKRLESIPDEDEGKPSSSAFTQLPRSKQLHVGNHQRIKRQKSFTRTGSETPSLIQDKSMSPTPSTEGSIGPGTVGISLLRNPFGGYGRYDLSNQQQDIQFFIQYFNENVTYHHYVLKYDHTNFLHTTLLDLAFTDEALLNSIVGFSAFQWTLNSPGGKITDFLQYYNKAVSLLLRSLRRHEEPGTTTLLTVLQLATIEETLGDWVNLLGHQKAALEILQDLYTPQTVVQSETSRLIFMWYSRFDVYASLVGGFATVVSREWFAQFHDFCQRRLSEDPNSIPLKYEAAIADLRLTATDIAILSGQVTRGLISKEEFLRQNQLLEKRLTDWRDYMDPALCDSRYQVTDFSGCPPLPPDDIVDPYIPGILYHGPLYGMNTANLDWHSIYLMHKHTTSEILKIPPSKELLKTAYASCQIFEAIELWPGSLKGALLACQQNVTIVAIFLPPDHRHRMWCRRKLALLENSGFIYPESLRVKMSALFQDPSCMQWWLPNEEQLKPIVKSMQLFARERKAQARDTEGEDVQDMRAILSSLNLEDKRESSSENPQSKGKSKSGQTNPKPVINVPHEPSGATSYGYNYEDQDYWDERERN